MNDNNLLKIPKRILGTLLNSAGAGVVSRFGLEYIAIGREREIESLLRDLDNISIGMGAFRFIVGKYGSGKSFLMGLARIHAQEKGFVTADADLSPERRFHGTHGQGIATYRELMKNLATKKVPDGNALPSILATWFNELQLNGVSEKKLALDSEELNEYVRKEILKVSVELQGGVNGFDFAKAIEQYYLGYVTQNDELREDALRYLRGEFTGKAAVNRSSLKLNSVIDDQNWYDYLKLYAVFFRRIGYEGFTVFLDECVNLYKIPNRVSRENNYEKILSMFNDTMQGKAEGIGFFLGATPQMIEDNRRGIFSYEALRSRLVSGNFILSQKQNLLSPLIYLERLTDDEIFALCKRLLFLHSAYYNHKHSITDQMILDFLQSALNHVSADTLITPREITRDFLNVLNLCYSNPDTDFYELLGQKKETVTEEDDFLEFNEIEL